MLERLLSVGNFIIIELYRDLCEYATIPPVYLDRKSAPCEEFIHSLRACNKELKTGILKRLAIQKKVI